MLSNEWYEELAVTEETPTESNSEVTAEVTEPEVESTEGAESEVKETTEEPAPISEYDIDGEKVKIDDIKEWRKGFLRQSDYTKKTQEVARIRKENEDAIELYNFLRDNPDIAKQLSEVAPTQKERAEKIVNPQIDDLSYRLSYMQIENDINRLKASNPDFDEVEVLNLATENNLPVEQAYNMWLGKNYNSMVEKKLKEQSSKLTEEIKKNGTATKSMIKAGDTSNKSGNYGLNEQQLSYADKLGMTAEEYKKWMR